MRVLRGLTGNDYGLRSMYRRVTMTWWALVVRNLITLAALVTPIMGAACTLTEPFLANSSGSQITAFRAETSPSPTTRGEEEDYSGLFQGLAIALITAIAGLIYNRSQLRLQKKKDEWERKAREAEVTVKLIPHLISQDVNERALAFSTLSQLGSSELASDLSHEFDEHGNAGLKTIEDKVLTAFSEKTFVTYVISPDHNTADEVRVEAVTTSTGPEPLRWRAVEHGTTAEGEQRASFDELDFRLIEEGSTSVLKFDPVVEDQGQIVGRMVFEPPIPVGSSSKWGYHFSWNGLWKQLRDTGKDEGSYSVATGIDLLELRWAFPVTCSNIRFTREPADAGSVKRKVEPNPMVIWRLENPRGVFSYSIEVDWEWA